MNRPHEQQAAAMDRAGELPDGEQLQSGNVNFKPLCKRCEDANPVGTKLYTHPAPSQPAAPDITDWGIDTSTGRAVLVYRNCSVIEDEQARYVFGLITAQPAPPVPEDGPMMARGTNANGTQWMGTMRQVMEDYKQAAEIEAREADRLRQRIAELESPPVPQTVQEIMRLMMPYVSVCIEFSIPKHNRNHRDDEAKVQAAFKPLQAALTALVEKNHELQFSLDGVNAMRGPEWQPIESALKDGTYVLLGSLVAGGAWVGKYEPQYQSGWRPENPWSSMMLNCWHLPDPYVILKPTHWMPLPPPPTHGIAEQGGNHG